MVEKIKDLFQRTIIWSFVLGLILTAFEGCNPREKIFTIGLAGPPSAQAGIFKGFKMGMAELGYIEGKNVRYIGYSKSLGNDDQLISDLSFETSETYLTINLKTAEKLGIDIPNSLLAQAKTIIR